jgi:hypothetical protein
MGGTYMHDPHTGENLNSGNFRDWQPENIIQVNQQYILLISEKISNDENCKFRQAVLRIFNHILASIDDEGKVSINARQLSKNLGVHYDTITKCIKYLRAINVIKTENILFDAI